MTEAQLFVQRQQRRVRGAVESADRPKPLTPRVFDGTYFQGGGDPAAAVLGTDAREALRDAAGHGFEQVQIRQADVAVAVFGDEVGFREHVSSLQPEPDFALVVRGRREEIARRVVPFYLGRQLVEFLDVARVALALLPERT